MNDEGASSRQLKMDGSIASERSDGSASQEMDASLELLARERAFVGRERVLYGEKKRIKQQQFRSVFASRKIEEKEVGVDTPTIGESSERLMT